VALADARVRVLPQRRRVTHERLLGHERLRERRQHGAHEHHRAGEPVERPRPSGGDERDRAGGEERRIEGRQVVRLAAAHDDEHEHRHVGDRNGAPAAVVAPP
jgi:hypothetical protein